MEKKERAWLENLVLNELKLGARIRDIIPVWFSAGRVKVSPNT